MAAQPPGLPQARLDLVFPSGGRAGTTVEIDLSGADLDGLTALHFDHAGLKAAPAGGNKFKVTIAADTPPGVYDARAAGKHGLSNPLAFAVSVGLEEVRQKTPNHTPSQAQPVPFGCAVNGRFSGSQDDFYRVPLKAGQRVIIEAQCERLDADADATLSVLAPDGREVASNTDHFGRDPLVDFTAKADGDHLVRVWDFHYRGGGAYRLLVGTRPVIDAVVPGAAEPDKETGFTLVGRNLPAGPVRLTAPVASRLLEPVRTAAADAAVFQHQVIGPHGASNAVTIRLGPGPHWTRAADNDAAGRAQELPAAGATITGSFDAYHAEHWYRVRLKAKEALVVDAAGERLGAPGDLFVQVFDPKGALLTTFDDHGTNLGGAYRGITRDPRGTFTAAADGEYRLRLRDRSGGGSAAHRYVLSVGPPRPDFAAYACWNLSENVKVPRPLLAGASQALDLVIARRDGFTGPVEWAAEGLPPFVKCPPARVPAGQDRGVLVFTADAGAPAWEGPVRLRCRAKVGEQAVQRDAWHSVMTVNAFDVQFPYSSAPSRVARQFWLAVRPGPAPFALTAAAPAEVVRGKKLPVKVALMRSPGFTGKVTLTAPQLPPGWKATNAEIAEGASEATVELEVPGNAAADTYTVALRGEGRAKVRDKQEATVALPTNLVTVVVREK